MEENRDIIKSILERGTEAQTPADLSSRVLANWKAESAALTIYAPLIPKWVWWMLGIIFSAALYWILNSTSSANSPSKVTGLLKKFSPQFDLNVPSIDPVMIMAVAVFGFMIMANALILKHQSRAV